MVTERVRRARLVFLGITALATVGVLIATRKILLPFVLALVIAYVLMPLVKLVERTRLPRWLAIIAVYIVVLGALSGFLAAVAPRLAREAYGLRRELPRISSHLRHKWVPAVYGSLKRAGLVPRDEPKVEDVRPSQTRADRASKGPVVVIPNDDGTYEVRVNGGVRFRQEGEDTWVMEPSTAPSSGDKHGVDLDRMLEGVTGRAVGYVQANLMSVLRFGSSVVMYLSRGVFSFFLTLMLAAYMMLSREQIMEFFRDLVPPSARVSYDVLLRRIDEGLSGVVRGQLVICLINGVLAAVGFSLLGVKYWPLLSMLAAVLSIIPIFGAILSSIPTVAIALTQGWGTALGALGWILGIHQVEANLLNPKIYGIAAKIHPVLVIFSLLVGEHFFGLMGALLAVPAMSIVQNSFLHFRTVALGEDAPSDEFLMAVEPKLVEQAAVVGVSEGGGEESVSGESGT